MRALVTGAGGMLGVDLVRALAADPTITLTAADRTVLDIRDPAAVHDMVAGHDVVINAAAWTDVDGAETAEEAATEINGVAVGHLARACAATGARLIQLSTDYVLPGEIAPGTPAVPWPEDAATAPVNAYGRGKLVGEQAVLSILPENGYVVRTAWLYGEHGRNFVSTMLRLATQRETLDVVDDQFGQPTWTVALAEQLVELVHAAEAGLATAGIYHGTSGGETTWAGLARAAFAATGLDPERIRSTTSAAFVRPARRPSYSVLGHQRWNTAGVKAQPGWHAQLTEALTRGVA
ncbi:dTDP-4-dehydrorhamnose reductase [Allocatelliglobosispora scoriae]|uniref:dTDP-4-dehydrorhamnose reductase n=1 Tax=Allocatelliglobosispora scoriae TaxID=643052 RepID=A0A841BXI1_9ACTN|nr:dTDP-4-dehydrorhamnose reductase [Allocatelliglobosispora scoriae]MBB5873857.1 dTDP-4-dehydrorhamnose reductase [Allocatelliglobosispora scoriae]